MFKFVAFAWMVIMVAESASSSLKQFSPFDKIEAEDYSQVSEAIVWDGCADITALGNTNDTAWVSYEGVDFEDGAELVTFYFAGNANDFVSGVIFLRLGSHTAEPVATVTVSSTAGNCNYIVITSFLPTLISGVQDLYLTFDSPTVDHIAHIDWFYFTRKYV